MNQGGSMSARLKSLEVNLGVFDSFHRFTPITDQEFDQLVEFIDRRNELDCRQMLLNSSAVRSGRLNLSVSDRCSEVWALDRDQDILDGEVDQLSDEVDIFYDSIWARHVAFYTPRRKYNER